jgi:hypothetical protein
MMCFKDMTFCSATCANKNCSRNWRLRDKSDYEKWSMRFNNNEGLIAFSDFSNTCNEYMPVEEF